MLSPATAPRHLIIKSGGAAAMPEWRAYFAEFAPQLVVHDWSAPPADRSLVDFALVWEPDAGVLDPADVQGFIAAAQTRKWDREPKLRTLA